MTGIHRGQRPSMASQWNVYGFSFTLRQVRVAKRFLSGIFVKAVYQLSPCGFVRNFCQNPSFTYAGGIFRPVDNFCQKPSIVYAGPSINYDKPSINYDKPSISYRGAVYQLHTRHLSP